jgi:Na+/H+ antiporter NhaD/arsenite permease-like protein
MVIERAGSPLVLLILIVFTGGVLSAMFLNDPVVLMLTPLVCGITLRLKRNPLPYLLALATAANVGSTATITGNPQNILIGTSSGIPYLVFLAHLGPVALVGLVIVVIVIRLLYPEEFRARHFEPLDPAPAVAPMASPQRAPVSAATAAGLVYAPILRKCIVVIVALLVALLAGVQPALAAFLAACALLITRRIKSEKILMLVDWQLLVMFTGLFVVTGALEITGVSQKLFDLVAGLAHAGVAPLTLVTTILSNTISNVPAVLLFRPLMAHFPNPLQAWLTLAAASTLAGNLTLIGSVANLIVAEQAAKLGVKVTFMEYLKAGVIITVLTLVIAVVWLEIVA